MTWMNEKENVYFVAHLPSTCDRVERSSSALHDTAAPVLHAKSRQIATLRHENLQSTCVSGSATDCATRGADGTGVCGIVDVTHWKAHEMKMALRCFDTCWSGKKGKFCCECLRRVHLRGSQVNPRHLVSFHQCFLFRAAFYAGKPGRYYLLAGPPMLFSQVEADL